MQVEASNTQQESEQTSKSHHALIGQGMLLPFLFVALLFPLWGFANDVTNPLVKAFKDIFLITNAQSSMVQFSFYLGYGVMAIPAAIFIRKYSYKSGILLGLALYAVGALLFIPASVQQEFNFFLAALCILTCGLALLETTANPYILSMGDPETATRRLNLAQAFNPIGSITGMFVASTVILNKLQVEEFRAAERAVHPEYAEMLPSVVDGKLTAALSEFAQSQPAAHQAMQSADLITIRGPYIAIAAVVVVLFLVFLFSKLPRTISHDHPLTLHELKATFKRLLINRCYIEGVVAQAFYVGAQIMCWTFIIHYGMTSVGLTAAQAQGYNIVAMSLFLVSRFVCTFLLGFIRPGPLLMLLALGGIILSLGTIFLGGMLGLYCLVGISVCMSLMFPTIYGIALKDLGDDASLGSAGLVMAIVGGALMPPLQASMIDGASFIGNIPSVQSSFLLPLMCFVVISIYGYRVQHVYKV
ncbi:L-fucose:H+ symporter permease [Paraglaciecola psychrophila]|uniref:L-fucose transporter n=1 Tax=Paraglaciecola psychrophila 170 TaxID=1129794 RepID=K7AB97_9ALTE|nr:L-fucose:H+ symporter permease [Paraglaciecola psychrophila]AGH44419.1 L-fucose transporter [Paraglaciecola psychrophila 170]GAC37973.1 MFS transporter, FHS family, L-fucose permease [Paraglaciecola psychrophila 170]